MNRVAEGSEQTEVGQMFNRISRRYDLANRILSFGIDQCWRRKAISKLGNLQNKSMLDVATGTGDMIWIALKKYPQLQPVGLDYAPQMLQLAKQKDTQNRVHWILGSADDLPLQDNSMDVITISFGIRNVANYQRALQEFYRVLKPNGMLAILEFSMPTNPLWKKIYRFYLFNLLPWIGGIVSGDKKAYHYLPKSVEAFPYGERLVNLMKEASFQEVQQHPLTGGIATLYTAKK
ncbi:MAG: bifunctional demethylmenaquinone methyltransferase/2-methoxy-6-polyprenyl-1,4-benzoquinol methylase UbiE [bacterium]|nr:bifunctional demethylmenaquinone methyltransferase/2-methoxy-6-polyprenyl-1,4-benzoquinol methylase UbiE [bacterium]